MYSFLNKSYKTNKREPYAVLDPPPALSMDVSLLLYAYSTSDRGGSAVGVQKGCFAFRNAQEPNKTNTVKQQGTVSSEEQIILT
jgi:hypothetical protein